MASNDIASEIIPTALCRPKYQAIESITMGGAPEQQLITTSGNSDVLADDLRGRASKRALISQLPFMLSYAPPQHLYLRFIYSKGLLM